MKVIIESDWIWFSLFLIFVIGVVLTAVAIATKYSEGTEEYCGPGWNAICIRVPEGKKKDVNGCIDNGESRLCGSYQKID